MKRTIIIECKSCNGTGLYKGMAERDNCAVICSACKGTGAIEFAYDEFEGRKIRVDLERVFKNSFGYVHSNLDCTTTKGDIIRFSEGGCSYHEWLNGVEPKPVKDLYCPYIWDNKGMGNEPLEDCNKHCKGFGSISNCDIYNKKNECWIKFEQNK